MKIINMRQVALMKKVQLTFIFAKHLYGFSLVSYNDCVTLLFVTEIMIQLSRIFNMSNIIIYNII